MTDEQHHSGAHMDRMQHVGRTVAQSEPAWEQPPNRPGAPNVLLIVIDDAGWSDFGCFGSEIATPNIDRLAASGLRYRNFHVTPLCSPTRTSLLTGRNHHSVGMGFLADTDTGFDRARGRIDRDVPLLPALLRDAGYGTYLVGKWHLAPHHEITPVGPFHNWPLARGFNRFYGFLDGCTDQISPEIYADNHPVTPPARDGYYLTEDLADQAISLLRDHHVFRPGHPFYLHFAPGAVHAPFQLPRRYIDKYVDVFAKGWDATRRDRLARQIEAGVSPSETRLTPRNPGVASWDELSDDEQFLYTHLQAAFAGFLEYADDQIGRILAELDELGQADNTIVLVMSDNGASAEGSAVGAINTNGPYGRTPEPVADQLDRLPDLGGPLGPAHYPSGWAMAGNTPFRRYKQFVDLGGVRSPLVVSWPARIVAGGDVRGQFVHAIDIAPTILELAGVDTASSIDGASITPTFAAADAPDPRDTQYWEIFGHRAIWHDGWAAVTVHTPGADYDTEDVWRLYRMDDDFSQTRDLAAEHPGRLRELTELWEREAKANGVFPLDDRTMVDLLELRTDQGMIGRTSLDLVPGQSHIPFASTLTGTDRSMVVTAQLVDGTATDGVIVASGNSAGGYTLYVQGDRLRFEHHYLRDRVVCADPRPLGPGGHSVGFRLARRADRSATVQLVVDGRVTASAEIPVTSAHISFYGLDVGKDPISQVSTSYSGEFAMSRERLRHVAVRFLTEQNLEEQAAAAEARQ